LPIITKWYLKENN